MAKVLSRPAYVRLRRLPGDDRLFITDNGHTDSGYLAEAHTRFTSGEVPYLVVEMEEHPYDLLSDGTDAARYEIRADRILGHDVDHLAKRAQPREYQLHQFLRVLEQVREWMHEGDPPPCGHEDVVETPEFGNPQTPGICMWCPVPLVKLNDEWIPA